MSFRPMFALHKDSHGNVLNAAAFRHKFQMTEWVRSLDIRNEDFIEFRETAARPGGDFDEVRPAFLDDDEPEAPGNPPPTDKLLEDEQPF